MSRERDWETARPLLWGLALLVDVGCVLYAEKRSDRSLPRQGHFPERAGLLFIVFLGAVVTELVRGAAEQRLRLADQWPALLAFLTVISLWRLSFGEAHTLPALLAKRSGKSGTPLSWSYVHLPLNMALSVLSVGLGLGIAEEGKAADRREWLLVSVSLVVIFLCLMALRALHHQAGPELQPSTEGAVSSSSAAGSPPAPSLSAQARLGGAAADPGPAQHDRLSELLRAELAWIEDKLSDQAEAAATQNQNMGDPGGAKGTGRTGQPES